MQIQHLAVDKFLTKIFCNCNEKMEKWYSCGTGNVQIHLRSPSLIHAKYVNIKNMQNYKN